MKSVFSVALNGLVIAAAIALALNNNFRTSSAIGNSYVEQFDRWFGFDELYRALERGR